MSTLWENYFPITNTSERALYPPMALQQPIQFSRAWPPTFRGHTIEEGSDNREVYV